MNSIISKLSMMLLMSVVFNSYVFADRVVVSNVAGEVVNATVRIGATNYNGDWYLPGENAKGLIYLQHGFARNAGNLRNLGLSLMESGFMVLSVNANMSGGNQNLAPDAADAIIDGLLVPPNGISMPQNVVLAGHSAGGLHATLMGARLVERNFSGFVGAILFDPVDANNLMIGASEDIVNASLPLYAILARGGSCNSNNNAEPILGGLNGSDFVGIKLTSSSTHIDAEGANAGFFARLFCGGPVSANISDLQDFAVAWAGDMLTGSYSSDYYPGGDVIDDIVESNRGYLIK